MLIFYSVYLIAHGEVPIKTDPQFAYGFVRHKYMTSSHGVCQSSSSQAWCTPVAWHPGLLDRIWTSKPEYHLHIHAPAAHEIVSGDGVGEC